MKQAFQLSIAEYVLCRSEMCCSSLALTASAQHYVIAMTTTGFFKE